MAKTLKEICADVGVTRRAVQGYEKAGLVTASGRNKYGHLLYDEAEEAQIQLIYFYREIGMSLKEIVHIMAISERERKEVLMAQLERLEGELEQLDDKIDRLNQHIAQL